MLRGKWSALWCCAWTLTYIGFLAANAHAAGFALYEWGTRANGMGGAVLASRTPDASAVAYNPATMTEIGSASMLAGATVITPSVKVKLNGVTTETDPQTFVVPQAFYMQPLSDTVWFGVGEFTRFGLGTEFSRSWPGNDNLYDVQFDSYSVQPTLAFKATDDLSVGIGVEVMKADIDIKRQLTGAGGDFGMHLTSEGYSIGANLSLFYKFNDEWAAGFVARTPMKLVGDGDVSFSGNMGAITWKPGDLTMSTTLPDSYSLGVSYTPTEQLSFEADAIYTRWEQYKEMKYEFGAGTGLGTVDSMKYWKNVWRFQLGGEYKALDWLAIRAGYIWDQEPIRDGFEDYMLPSNDRQLVTTGLGFTWDNWTLDLSYMYLWTLDRNGVKIANAGTPFGGGGTADFQDNHAHLIGTSIGYTF
jgi:long-chain fatty acid transport protein